MILGVKILGHDNSCTVIRSDGSVALFEEEERLSRVKGGRYVFSPDRVAEVLSEIGCTLADMEHVVFVSPGSRVPRAQAHLLPFSARARRAHFERWVDLIRAELAPGSTIRVYGHHFCHAASAAYAAPYDDCDVLTLDGFGDGESGTMWTFREGRLRQIWSQDLLQSVPYLYRSVATWVGLSGQEREGKLMALAAYGTPRYVEWLGHWASRNCMRHNGRAQNDVQQFKGIPIHHRAWALDLERSFSQVHLGEHRSANWRADMASSVQVLLEQHACQMLAELSSRGGSSCCALAGGAFLNGRVNWRIAELGTHKSVWVQPLASDAGLSMGAALARASELGYDRWTLDGAHLGHDLNCSEVQQVAAGMGLEAEKLADPIDWAADLLAEGRLVGWCWGRAAIGQRALGNRSILAVPRPEGVRDSVNDLKNRERWRPFAPVVLESEIGRWTGCRRPIPYMNEVRPWIVPGAAPAAVHVDGSARVQTVNEAHNPRLVRLLKAVRARTGAAVLLNTSLNARGEPIARGVEDCLRFFVTGGVDALVVAGYGFGAGSGDRHGGAGLTPRLELVGCRRRRVGSDCRRDRTLHLHFEGGVSFSEEGWCSRCGEGCAHYVRVPAQALLRVHLPKEVVVARRRDYDKVRVYLPTFLQTLDVAAPRLLVQVRLLLNTWPTLVLVGPDGREWDGASLPNSRGSQSELGDLESHIGNASRWCVAHFNLDEVNGKR